MGYGLPAAEHGQRAAEELAVFLAAIAASPQLDVAPELEEVAEAGAADAAGPQPGVAAPPHEVAAAEAGEAGADGPQPDLAAAPADAALLVPAPGPDPLVCGECGKRFATARGVKCHATHAHGRKRPPVG